MRIVEKALTANAIAYDSFPFAECPFIGANDFDVSEWLASKAAVMHATDLRFSLLLGSKEANIGPSSFVINAIA